MIVSGAIAQALSQMFVGDWSTNWPLLLLPLLAYLCSEKLSAQVELLSYRCKQKHTLAVLLTSLPGLVFLSLGMYATAALRHAEIHSVPCVMVFVVPIIIFSIGIANAAISLRKNLLLVKQLLVATKRPDEALSELGKRRGMNIRVLPIDEFACMTVGILHPTVVLSTGVTERLSAQELEAVLLHEEVHVRRKDTLWATLSRFVSDCCFRYSTQAEAIARRTREITADYEAAKSIDAHVLASVLVKFARHPPTVSYSFAEAFACPTTISERVRHLIEDGSVTHEEENMSKIAVQVGLACTLIFYPYLVHLAAAVWLRC
jgi:Zn-dependent protease with chaperone function